MAELPWVYIVILNWNSATDTLACLDAVAQLTYPRYSLLVVDNGSTDDSVRCIAAKHPQTTILPLAQNLGYTGGNNRGIEFALQHGCDYIWLLNDDTLVAPDSLANLVAVASAEPAAGALGPKVYTQENSQTLLSTGGNILDDGRCRQRGVGERDRGQYDKLCQMDFLSGCALLMSRTVIQQIGMLDDSFFAYQEDVDWCYRARQAGFRVLYVPYAQVSHPDTRRRDANSQRVVYYMIRNELFFAAKHQLGCRVHTSLLFRYLRLLLTWTLRRRWRHKRKQRDALVAAIIDFARGKTGKNEQW